MSILHRMAMAASNSLLSTQLLRPSISHFPKRLVSVPTCCLYANMKKKKKHTMASLAIATESSESATLSQNDNVKTETQNEKTDKIVLPTNESSEKLLRVRHTVMYNNAITGPWAVISHFVGNSVKFLSWELLFLFLFLRCHCCLGSILYEFGLCVFDSYFYATKWFLRQMGSHLCVLKTHKNVNFVFGFSTIVLAWITHE